MFDITTGAGLATITADVAMFLIPVLPNAPAAARVAKVVDEATGVLREFKVVKSSRLREVKGIENARDLQRAYDLRFRKAAKRIAEGNEYQVKVMGGRHIPQRRSRGWPILMHAVVRREFVWNLSTWGKRSR